jgi:Fe-S cluster assembly iron-binding protein IscA
MEIKVDDKTLEILKDELDAEKKDVVRIDVMGFGWAGPTLGIVLDEQGQNDEIRDMGGVKFAVDKEIVPIIQEVTVIHTVGPEGVKIAIAGEGGGCCS